MRRKGASLAARFRRAIRSERDERAEQERARELALEAAREARDSLFVELAEFARAVEFLSVEQTQAGLILRFSEGGESRELTFAPVGEADRVGVTFTGQPAHEHHELYRQPELDDRWIWSRRRVKREDRLPLFDEGLEELLVRGLGLPRPGDESPPPAGERAL